MEEFDFPINTVFYNLENAIKKYRKISQKRISECVGNITIDQALILIIIQKHPEFNQIDIAKLLFKDYASMTRMIELLIKNKYIVKSQNISDRRSHILNLTRKGEKIIDELKPIIMENRKLALRGINQKEVDRLNKTLSVLIGNCE